MAGTPALLNVSRLNNFRLNAVDPVLVKQRENRVGILLNGQDVRGRVRVHTLTIRDSINDAPNSASFTIEGPPRSPYVDAVLADQPIAFWRLGDITTTALDQTGHGHTGTVVGGVSINQPGAIGDGDRSMHFPGIAGARIEVPAAPELALTQGVTLELWVKTDTVAQIGGMLEKTIGGTVNTSYSLFQINATWVFRVMMGGGAYDVSLPIDPVADVGQWVHLIAGWVPGGMWIYKNGVFAAYLTVPAGTLDSGAGPVLLGHLGSGVYPFTGSLDEVAIYSYLNGNSILAHATIGRAVAAPTIAQEVRITLGVDDPVLLFNGAVSQVDLSYEGRAHLPIYSCNATDDMARANRRRPFGQWTNVSASIVAQALIATFVPGFGSTFVQAGLPPITVIFDGSEGMNRCLTQITNLIGGYWYFADRQLHLFLTEGTDAPDPIDATHPFLADPRITAAVEMSQVRTRVYGRGHGEALLSAVLTSETLIPIASVVMFNAAGGRAIALSQVLTYTGIYLGGVGSLIGPGAAPSVAVTATIASGAGLAAGPYTYAYTFVTANGESLPGPLTAIVVGLLAPPASAPSLSAPTYGTGPNPGAHAWAVTFVTASGETTMGPAIGASTDVTPAPATAPSVGNIVVGPGPNPGVHDYVVTFVTGMGETTQGPGVSVTTGYETRPVLPPAAPTCAFVSHGAADFPIAAGSTLMCSVTFRTASGETTAGPKGSVIVPGSGMVYGGLDVTNIPIGPPGTSSRFLYWSNGGQTVYVIQIVDNVSTSWWLGAAHAGAGNQYSSTGQFGPLTNTAGSYNVNACQVSLANLPKGDANVTARNLYRTAVGNATLRLVATIANNTATTFTDTVTDAQLGAAVPTVSTAYLQRFTLTVPLGPALVTGRRIYRTTAGGGAYLLAAVLADNVTVSWTDTIPDASLGAAAPATNTATANQVQLAAIAVGASTVTARKVYRTAVNGAQLKLLTTLANNSTLTYLDANADAALGANVPTSDTSGLTQPQGQVNAGSPTLPTASAGPFLTSGWALIGTQAIRYTGISGNTLTGIPASGPGALVATVRYGDHILSAPMLTGVAVPGGLIAPVGTVIYLWVQRDDAAAQAAMARLDGGDGVYEYLVQDERRGEPSLTALCDAHLTQYKSPIQTLTYATRDLKTKSGKPIRVDLASPSISGTLVIQDVTIDQIDTSPGVAPRFVVTASTVRFSLEDLLRQLAGALEVTPL